MNIKIFFIFCLEYFYKFIMIFFNNILMLLIDIIIFSFFFEVKFNIIGKNRICNIFVFR